MTEVYYEDVVDYLQCQVDYGQYTSELANEILNIGINDYFNESKKTITKIDITADLEKVSRRNLKATIKRIITLLALCAVIILLLKKVKKLYEENQQLKSDKKSMEIAFKKTEDQVLSIQRELKNMYESVKNQPDEVESIKSVNTKMIDYYSKKQEEKTVNTLDKANKKLDGIEKTLNEIQNSVKAMGKQIKTTKSDVEDIKQNRNKVESKSFGKFYTDIAIDGAKKVGKEISSKSKDELKSIAKNAVKSKAENLKTVSKNSVNKLVSNIRKGNM